MHKTKKHKKKKECDDCDFVADISIVFRRHKIQKHQQKCESCEFISATPSAMTIHKQAEHGGGVLRTSAGFMITSDASNDVCEEPTNQGSTSKGPRRNVPVCRRFVRKTYCQGDILSWIFVRRFVRKTFCQHVFCETFCQEDILSVQFFCGRILHRQIVRKTNCQDPF